MKKFLPLPLLLLLVLNFALYSQFVRKVVVEEATNASCGPCATQNPSFQRWLSNHLDRVIPVIYHAWWPGKTDPMYLYDTIMNQKRINYYGITGVPSGRVNGKIAPSSGSWYEGAVGDTLALNNQLNAEPIYSAMSIEIKDFNYNSSNGSGTVKIDVTSLIPISNVRLRVVICEEHHYYANAGTNGEKDFFYLARKMLPNADGTLISINENETKSFEFSFTVDPSFTDDLYVAAFIQNDETKEILQGAWTKNYSFKEPDFALFLLSSNLVNVGKEGDSFQLEAYVLNNTSNSATFNVSIENIDKLPADWSVAIENNQTQITVDPMSKKAIKAILTVGTTPYASDIKLKINLQNGSYSESSASLNIYHKSIQRLHILGGETTHSIQSIIDEGLGIGYMFNIPEKYFATYASNFTSLNTIVWDGSKAGQFTATSANIIYDALSKNQNILICGGRITAGMISNGVLPYFGIAFISYCREGYGQPPYPVKLSGVPGDPITGDFGNNIQGYLIDYLLPLYRIVNSNTTTPIMTFAKSADSICAVKVQLTKSRAIVLGMNPFILADSNLRKTLITRSMLWLEGKLSEVTFDFGLDKEMKVAPNPTSLYSYLGFQLEKPVTFAKIELLDIFGRIVKTIHEGSIVSIGEQSFEIDFRNLPSQLYFIRINLDGNIKMLPLVKID